MKYKKTILFLNLRFADFYSKELLIRLKEEQAIRFVAVLDHQFKETIPSHIAPLLDQVYTLPAKKKQGFLAEFSLIELRPIVRSELKNTSDLRIVCTDEFNLLNAGRIRREFSLEGHTDSDLLPFRHKIKMKQMLLMANIRLPRFRLLKESDQFQNLAYELNLPFIIKPIDSCGSHGVYKIYQSYDFERFLHEMGHDKLHMQVEEYIDGTLYHVDSLTENYKQKFICANEYTCPNHDYTQGKVLGSIPLDQNDPLRTNLIIFAKSCLHVLGANNIVNHMELFVSKKGEIIFLEVSGRPPGALINLAHELNFGIQLMDEDFFMQTDTRIKIKPDTQTEHAFWAYFPLRPGKIIQLNPPETQSRFTLKWFVEKNIKIDKNECNNTVGKAAQAIFYNKDKAILKRDFNLIKNHSIITVAS